jgi:hypothetical protein
MLRKEHNYYADEEGIPNQISNEVNRWMDKPSISKPGCFHRTERHSTKDCSIIADKLANEYGEEARELAYLACQIHRKKDRETEKCGCKQLYDEFFMYVE